MSATTKTDQDERLFERARLLTKAGQAGDAKRTYMEILARSPGHFGALNNLGALLHGTRHRNAACTVYLEAIARHPRNPLSYVNLANILRENGDLTHARQYCENALSLTPYYKAAHQALANVLAELGDDEQAAYHRQLGFEDQAAITIPYRGKGTPVSVLLLVSAVGGNVPIQHLLDDRLFHVSVIYADYWNLERPLPPHDIVFNAIGDADLCGRALDSADRLLVGNKAPILNPPAAVLRTGRVENAARLAKLSGVRTAKTVTLPRRALQAQDAIHALAGFSYPLLLRTPGYHTGRHFLRVEAADTLAAAAATLPGKDVTAIEYLDARGADGRYRKYRAMFIQGKCYPLHLAISKDWKVHYYTAAMSDCAEYRTEEKRFLNDMRGVIGDRGMSALYRIRDELGLDYAGIDFGLSPDREILFFEANATMVVNPPDDDARWIYRRGAIAQIQSAVHAMLIERTIPG